MSHDDDTRSDERWKAQWKAAEPPEGFADRVLEARRRAAEDGEDAGPARPGGSPWTSRPVVITAAVVAGACVVALVVGLTRTQSRPEAAGEIRAEARASVALGHRGVAVAEPGAELSWTVAASGAASVEQRAGEVFYRVDRGGAFVVDTPVGRVEVEGTCFRVEVESMNRKNIISAGVGAALATAIVVTVYEGTVRVASGENGDAVEVGPGERVVVRDGTSPQIASGDDVADQARAAHPRDDTPLAPPPDDISRDDLLARDGLHRDEIARLRAEVAALEGGRKVVKGGPRDREEPDGRPWFDPSEERLREFAAECRVRYDAPPVTGSEPFQVTPKMMERMGITEEERVAINEVLEAMHVQWSEALRILYIEATGDTAGADTLSPQAMAREISDKSIPGAMQRVQKRIAWERAGLVEPPADWSNAPPIERYYRMLSQVGDDMEGLLAARLGPARARELREENGGWGQRIVHAGCPDDDEANVDVDN